MDDPALRNSGRVELTPHDAPTKELIPITMSDGLNTTLLNRSDISQAIRNMRATTTRLGVAQNEILPQLDLLVSTYVAGLEGQSRVFSALGNELSEGGPSYSLGLQFEAPLGNRAARARLERRRWEMVRATSQFRLTVEQALTETEVAIREVQTTHREMRGKFDAMVAADNEAKYLLDRWRTLPGLDDSATLLLEDLLDSQERRTDEEGAFVESQVNYAVALVRLRKAMGTLLRFDRSPPESQIDRDPAVVEEVLPSPAGEN